jgi:alpha-D-ribose 1-methylphosphonate 5-phosphate C-P lyase
MKLSKLAFATQLCYGTTIPGSQMLYAKNIMPMIGGFGVVQLRWLANITSS